MPEGGDYTGLLLGEKKTECLKSFLNYLFEHKDWDFIYFYDVPETSSILGILFNLESSIPKPEIGKGTLCPYILLPSSTDTFYKELDKKLRKNLRRCLRNLKRDYHKIELKSYNEFDSLKNAMNTFFELHQKRWQSKQMPGVFNTQTIRNFYIDVAKNFADNGWLALYFLSINDEPIAAQYGFEYKQVLYYALSGFNPDYSKYSIGNLLTLKIIEKCIHRKLKEFDFMKGGEPYKFGWTNTCRTNLGFKFVNRKRAISRIYNLEIKVLKKLQINKILGKLRF
jgi:hypothetical protein